MKKRLTEIIELQARVISSVWRTYETMVANNDSRADKFYNIYLRRPLEVLDRLEKLRMGVKNG